MKRYEQDSINFEQVINNWFQNLASKSSLNINIVGKDNFA